MTRSLSSIINTKWFAFASIVMLCFAIHGNTLTHDFNLDDFYIIDNIPKTGSLLDVGEQSFDRVDYRPIAIAIFTIEDRLFGSIQPGRAHLINVLFFIVNAFLLYWCLLLLFRSHEFQRTIALCAVLIFIVHPIHSNVVSSIKSRDILISFCFAITSFNLFILYVRNSRRTLLFFSLLLATLGLFAKLDSIWALAIMPVYFIIQEKKVNWKAILKFSVIAFLCFFAVMIRFDITKGAASDQIVDINPILFTENPMIGAGLKGIIFYTFYSIFYYVKFLVIPLGYYFYFGYQVIPGIHFLHPFFLFGIALFALYIYWLLRYYKRDKTILTLLVFFGLALLFFVNFLRPVAGVVAPRLAFHASAPFCALVALLLLKAINSEPLQNILPAIKGLSDKAYQLLFLTTVLCLCLAPFTIIRNADWKNQVTLMDADIPNLKYSFQANRIASATYLRLAENPDGFKIKKDWLNTVKKGLAASRNAVMVDPESIYTQEGVGIAERLLGNNEAALRQFAIVIEKFDTSEVAWDFSGDILAERGAFDSAQYFYENAIRVSPLNPLTHEKLVNVSLRSGTLERTKRFYQKAAVNNPQWFVPYNQLGIIAMSEQDSLAATQFFGQTFVRGNKNRNIFEVLTGFLKRNGHTEALEILNQQYYN